MFPVRWGQSGDYRSHGAISNKNPGANVDSGAFGRHHVVVERCHRILLMIVDEFPYLALQLSVFNRQALRGIPRGD